MKIFVITSVLLLNLLATPAFAGNHDNGGGSAIHNRHSSKYAVGNMYTRALNNIEASGMLDLLDINRHVPITDMHIDHGQVFVTLQESTGRVTIVYDPIANKLLRESAPVN